MAAPRNNLSEQLAKMRAGGGAGAGAKKGKGPDILQTAGLKAMDGEASRVRSSACS